MFRRIAVYNHFTCMHLWKKWKDSGRIVRVKEREVRKPDKTLLASSSAILVPKT